MRIPPPSPQGGISNRHTRPLPHGIFLPHTKSASRGIPSAHNLLADNGLVLNLPAKHSTMVEWLYVFCGAETIISAKLEFACDSHGNRTYRLGVAGACACRLASGCKGNKLHHLALRENGGCQDQDHA